MKSRPARASAPFSIGTLALFLLVISSCQKSGKVHADHKQEELERRVELLESRVQVLMDRSQTEEAKKKAQNEGFKVHELPHK
jgi:hypothetical protein